MNNLFIILFIIMPLVAIFCLWYLKKEKILKQENDKKVLLTKKDLLEISRKNYGTHSWHRKIKK